MMLVAAAGGSNPVVVCFCAWNYLGNYPMDRKNPKGSDAERN